MRAETIADAAATRSLKRQDYKMADTKQDFKKLLETRMSELVEKGTLVAIGADKLYAQTKDEFAEQLKKAKCRFGRKKFA